MPLFVYLDWLADTDELAFDTCLFWRSEWSFGKHQGQNNVNLTDGRGLKQQCNVYKMTSIGTLQNAREG